jgi:hypothetical protein
MPGDAIVFNDPRSRFQIFDRYYFKRRDLVELFAPVPRESPLPYMVINEDNLNTMGEIAREYRRVWFIFSHVGDRDDIMERRFGGTYRLLFYRNYFAIEIFLLEKRGAPDPQRQAEP